MNTCTRRGAHTASRVMIFLAGVAMTACGASGGLRPTSAVATPADHANAATVPTSLSTPATGTACDLATGRVLLVGPGKTYAVPSAAAAVAQAGDIIKISAGNYTGDAAAWNQDNLTICGTGGRAVLYSGGKSVQGKGIWVISGANVTLDSIEFHNATIPYSPGNGNNNGAAVRIQNTTGSFTVINCGFYDGENGILGGLAGTPTTVTIDRSEFARNGYGDGYTHNLYIGQIARLTVTASYFHEAKVGHNLKSRAAQTHIENSYFMDGSTGTASYTMDFPNGGQVYLRGNLLQKGVMARNPTVIAYGDEGLMWSVNRIQMLHNTLVDNHPGGAFINAVAGTQSLAMTANLFALTSGTALINSDGIAASNVNQQASVTGNASDIAGASSIGSPDFWPAATLAARLNLPVALDLTYSADAPEPMIQRALIAAPTVTGALQLAP